MQFSAAIFCCYILPLVTGLFLFWDAVPKNAIFSKNWFLFKADLVLEICANYQDQSGSRCYMLHNTLVNYDLLVKVAHW